ncbi:MAG: hypothetical protein ABR556_14365, partial [Pyrinomonadaceae bacterium]
MQAVNKYRQTGAAFLASTFILCLVVNYQGASSRALAQRGNQASIAPRKDYVAAAEMLERFIQHEMQDKGLPSLSIALVDDQ